MSETTPAFATARPPVVAFKPIILRSLLWSSCSILTSAYLAHLLIIHQRQEESDRKQISRHSDSSESKCYQIASLLLFLIVVKQTITRISLAEGTSTKLDTMTTRSLVSPSRPNTAQDNPYARSPSATFKLQPPPIRRREKRKGRIFNDLHHEAAPVDENDKTVPSAHPLQTTLRQFQFGQSTYCAKANMIASQIVLSPKQILPNDVRIVFTPPFDRDEFEDRTARQSPSITPRASRFSSASSTPVRKNFVEKSSSKGSVGTQSTVASATSNETVGTFGNLRRRSSARNFANSTASVHYNQETSCSSHVIVCVSPRSPLTPNSRAQCHSPKNDEYALSSVNLLQTSYDQEPLSATLRRLGAARKSHNFAPLEEENEEGAAAAFGWTDEMSRRVEAHTAARSHIERGATAAKDAEILLATDDTDEKEECIATSAYVPGLGVLGSLPLAPRKQQRRKSIVQSTVRGAARKLWHKNDDDANERSVDASIDTAISKPETSSSCTTVGRRTSLSLVSYILGNPQRPRTTHTDVFLPTLQEQPAEPGMVLALAQHSRGDGWGGLRPRTSWFPNLRLGPLLSPLKKKETAAGGLAPIQLKCGYVSQYDESSDSTGAEKDDSSWIDEPVEASEDEKAAPLSSTRSIMQTLRVRFPSQLPEPNKERMRLALSSEKESRVQDDDSIASSCVVVTYTNTSAEGRPVATVSKKDNLPRARRILASVIIIAVMGAVACVLVLLVTGHVGHHRS